jgi:Cu2+-containing amine oxidase
LHACGASLADYVDGEGLAGKDPTLWYSLSFHLLPRDEDQPAMPLRFDGFALAPRDLWATNPLGSP